MDNEGITLFNIDYYLIYIMTQYQDSDAPVIKALRGKGYKATPQRIAIARFVLHSHEHPSAQTTYLSIKKVYPTVSLATVYKTIKILKEFGLVQELSLSQGETRFDPNTEPHAHLFCLQCGSISDWMDPLIIKLVDRISKNESFSVRGSSLDINGLCKICARMDKNAVIAQSTMMA